MLPTILHTSTYAAISPKYHVEPLMVSSHKLSDCQSLSDHIYVKTPCHSVHHYITVRCSTNPLSLRTLWYFRSNWSLEYGPHKSSSNISVAICISTLMFVPNIANTATMYSTMSVYSFYNNISLHFSSS